MSDEGNTNYKHPGNVRLRAGLFWVTNYFGETYKAQLTRADEMLTEHGLGLDCWPGRNKAEETTLEFEDRLIEEEDYLSLRSRAAEILKAANKTKHVPILFCQFRYAGKGVTVWNTPGTPGKCWEIPMCLISPTPGSDNATLLHEMGHASGLDHDKTSTDALNRNLMHEVETRTTIMKWQVQKMAAAKFSSAAK